jgi:hypothetical protein
MVAKAPERDRTFMPVVPPHQHFAGTPAGKLDKPHNLPLKKRQTTSRPECMTVSEIPS